MGTRGKNFGCGEPFDDADGDAEVERAGEVIGVRAEEMLSRKFVEALVMSFNRRDALLEDFVNVSVFCIFSHFLLISDHGKDGVGNEVTLAELFFFLDIRSPIFLLGLEFHELSDSSKSLLNSKEGGLAVLLDNLSDAEHSTGP